MTINKCDRDSLGAVVGIHVRAFPGFFLSDLGPRFLREYYRLVMTYPAGICRVAEEGGQVVGFVAGFGQPQGFYRALRRRKLCLAALLLPRVLRHPGLVRRLLVNFHRTGRSEAPSPRSCELSSVAVDPACGRRGLGQALVRAFVEAADDLGADCVYLSTDAADNESVNRFYQRLGFTRTRSFESAPGRLMNEYILPIRE